MMYEFNKVLLLVLLTFCTPYSFAQAVSQTMNSAPELIEKIKSGGYIIYMRHGKTVRKNANRDTKAVDLAQCDTQRNLSAEGRAEVKEIGIIIKKLNIPIGKVYSSPFCRTKETAKIVFGNFSVDEKLAFSMGKIAAESKMLGEYLHQIMLATTDKKSNTIFVGHTANLRDGLGVWPKPEGVLVVFEKIANNITYLGMITPEQWPNYKPKRPKDS